VGLPGLLKRRLPIHRLVPAMALAALLGGCLPARREQPVMLYVAIAVQDESGVTSENAAFFRQRFYQLVKDFRRVHPNVLMQLSLYPESQLRQRLQLRDRAGLGPDLILTGADSANTLLRVGLTDPIPDDPQLRDASSPTLLQRLRNRRGQIAAQPMALFPQLACYDRRRLPAPPTSLSGLLESSAAGVQVGLAIELRQLLWTAGGFGAIPGLKQAALGQQPNPLERAQIRSWLTWLQQASNQQRVTFIPNQSALRRSLSSGGLAWVSCNSGDLELMRRKLGPHLGVSALPNGAAHPASPVNRLRVLALGRNSSGAQREMSLEMIRFTVAPLVQRALTLDSLSFLPANPRVSVPVQSSSVLQAMVTSRQQALSMDHMMADIHQEDPRLAALQNEVIVPVLFGLVEPKLATQQLITILRRQP
jgi:hypothetical protein